MKMLFHGSAIYRKVGCDLWFSPETSVTLNIFHSMYFVEAWFLLSISFLSSWELTSTVLVRHYLFTVDINEYADVSLREDHHWFIAATTRPRSVLALLASPFLGKRLRVPSSGRLEPEPGECQSDSHLILGFAVRVGPLATTLPEDLLPPVGLLLFTFEIRRFLNTDLVRQHEEKLEN